MSTFLCISSYFKGNDFLISCKEQGNTVYLVTSEKLRNEPWAREYLDDIFFINQKDDDDWNMEDVIAGTAYLMRSKKIDRIVALDDFDVEKAALLRETFRIPGMGQTTVRHFRDKLAMRVQAQNNGILVPAFSSLFHDEDINQYLQNVSAPWVIKPRGEASATGITKCHNAEEAWEAIHKLGNKRHGYLIEQFKPGDVYHVDAINYDNSVKFAQVSKYLATPMDVAHGGGIFRSVSVNYGQEEDKNLQALNQKLMEAFGMNYSATHTEFIKCFDDGKYYFLETASRVGGANLAEMVYYASGIQLWKEWAKVETCAANGDKYKLPKPTKLYSGIIISLSRYDKPDYNDFDDPEVKWTLDMDHHVGVIIQTKTQKQAIALLDKYAQIINEKYHASAPVPTKPTH